jgi:serine/threonine protein kinase
MNDQEPVLSQAARSLLLRGNRTEVTLEVTRDRSRVRKQLRDFANVSSERRALYREAHLQWLSRGPGVVSVFGGQLWSGDLADEPEAPEGELLAVFRGYVPGASLREILGRPAELRSIRLRALKWMRALFGTLARLHSLTDANGRPLGLFHRDVTADNVLVDETGAVWLNDFGLAHTVVEGPLEDERLLMGARDSLPPEVREGRQPDGRSDVYQAALLCARLLEPERARQHDISSAELISMGTAFGWPRPLCDALSASPEKRPLASAMAQSLS